MIVKEKSIIEFFRKHVIGFEELKQDQHYNPYYLMRDQLFVRGLNSSVDKSDVFKFQIIDFAKNSQSKLTNIYTYNLYPYDDVCHVLELVDFSTEVSEVSK